MNFLSVYFFPFFAHICCYKAHSLLNFSKIRRNLLDLCHSSDGVRVSKSKWLQVTSLF
jgi:hypothetical protein